MVSPLQAVQVRASASLLATDVGPLVEARYALVVGLGIFSWMPGSTLTSDGRTVIVPTGGGPPGAWVLLRVDDSGADLTDADATIQIGAGAWRTLPVSTLSDNRTLTLGTTNAAAGDTIEVTRLDVEAFTLAIVNGGTGAGTLVTLPISARSNALFQFDGTDWTLRRSALLL